MDTTQRTPLPASLTLASVPEAHEGLLAGLEQHPSIELDLSAVEEIDTAGAQWLVWLVWQGGQNGHPVALLAPSAPVRRIFATLGLPGLPEEDRS